MGIHDREHLEVAQTAELYDWLAKNHQTSPGLWVVTHKKASGKPAPTYDELVRVALCFGWVDSIPGKIDEHKTKLYFAPRKPKSVWSQSNKLRVEELIKTGQMLPAGLATIELAKKLGTWTTIDSAQNAEIPDDLKTEFANYPGSLENFEAFPRGVRKQILEWISLAKTETTRTKRINETASLAQQNIRANQWRDKNPRT